MFKINPPYFGAAYYPEAWAAAEIDRDIEMMKKAGMNVMRIGEFAWSNMEPEEGGYDFSFMHMVIDKLKAAGIATVMCTPTCTPPIWMASKYPEIFMVNDAGIRATHGGRRCACVNNEIYLDFSRKITRAMAREFAEEESVIGWQIDNELAYNAFSHIGCCCPVCVARFQADLKEKYGAPEALNDAWNTHVWSLEYNDFLQIPKPTAGVWSHPSYLTEYIESQARAFYRFADMQADILHEYVSVPVGTDMMPFLGLSYEETNKKMDVVQFNHYNSSQNLWETAFWCDYLRNIKDKPFWITETSTCWGGGAAMSHLTEPGFCIANTWLPMTLGAEATLYWLWRAHFGGHELMHGSVVDSWCRPLPTFGEVRQISDGFEKASDMINNTKPQRSKIAIHLSQFSDSLYRFQPMVNGFSYLPSLQQLIYRPLAAAQMRAEVISPAQDLADYEIIITPFLPCIEEYGLNERIFDWVEKGGVWIVGPMTDTRTSACAKYLNAPRGFLEDKTDVSWQFHVPNGKEYALEGANGEIINTVSVIYEAFSVKGASKVLASHKGGFADGYAAITETRLGHGKIVTMGAALAADDYAAFIKNIASERGIYPICEASDNIAAAVHIDKGGEEKYFTAVEVGNKEGGVILPRDCENVFTRVQYKKGSRAALSAHEAAVYKYL